MSYLQMQDPTLERSFRGHKDVITGLAFKPSMTQLASASMDHSVMIWNFKPQLRAFRFVGHKAPVTSVDFSPSGHLLASSSRDKTVRLWTPSVKGDVTVFKAHTSTVRTVQFSNDGQNLLTASDDKTIKLWSTLRTKFQFTLAGHMNWVRTAKFSPDSRLIISGSDDKTIRLWDVRNKSCIRTYWDHTGMVSSVSFHPSGTVIASASSDRSIKLFDIRTHKLIQHYGDAHGAAAPSHATSDIPSSGGGVNSVAFGGQNGEWLVSTGLDGVVKIWDVKEGHLFYTLHGHKHGPTTSAVFSSQGDFFATGGSDSQILVWKSNFDQFSSIPDENGISSGRSINDFSHQPHTIHADPAIAPAVDVRSRPKTPPIAATIPITAGPLGLSAKVSAGGLAGNTIHSRRASPEIVNIGPSPFVEPDVDSPTFGTQSEEAEIDEEQEVIPSSTTALEVRTVSDQIASSIQQLVKQMDVLTQTMSILERRLTINEDRLIDVSRQLNKLNAGSVAKQVSPVSAQPEQGSQADG